jgi:hypothetical protein
VVTELNCESTDIVYEISSIVPMTVNINNLTIDQ